MDAQILLVEDDPSIREVTALGLRAAGFTVTTAADGVEGLDRWRADRPDLVLLDVMLPRPRRPRGVPRDPARVDDADRDAHGPWRHDRRRRRPRVGRRRLRAQAVRDAGARRPRQGGPAPANRRRRRGRRPGETAIALGDLRIDLDGRTVERDGEEIPLTRTEFDLLVELARHPGRVFTRDLLLDRVWGYDYLGDSRLVDVAVGRLRSKVEADPAAPALVLTVRGAGYKAARPTG